MKTAEEWMQDVDYPNKEDTTVLLSPQQIKIIQLDAMKEGMRRAALVCDDTDTIEAHQSYYAQLGDASATRSAIHKAILTAAEQLPQP